MVARLVVKLRILWFCGAVFLFWVSSCLLYAGGSGLNVLVVVNQNSSNSCEVGNYFCERRQVPPENLLRILWSGGNISWTNGDFQTNLINPLLAALATRPRLVARVPASPIRVAPPGVASPPIMSTITALKRAQKPAAVA